MNDTETLAPCTGSDKLLVCLTWGIVMYGAGGFLIVSAILLIAVSILILHHAFDHCRGNSGRRLHHVNVPLERSE